MHTQMSPEMKEEIRKKTEKKSVMVVAYAVIILILGTLFTMLMNLPAKADSIICDDIIFTETSSDDIILDIKNTQAFKLNNFKIIPSSDVYFYSNGWTGAYLYHPKGKRIAFGTSRCTFISDDINSTETLEWYLMLQLRSNNND